MMSIQLDATLLMAGIRIANFGSIELLDFNSPVEDITKLILSDIP